MISAYAGTAKSSTLKLAAPGIRQPALALAFNKKIADELRPDLPSYFTVKTLNSLGHNVWARGLSASRITVDDRKLGKLVTQLARDQKCDLSPDQWHGVRELASAAMLAGISPSDIGEPLLADSPENWQDLTDLSPNDFGLLYPLARNVLAESIRLARLGTISFDDQIYCPTILGSTFPKWPVIFVDESQDLSPLNHQMLRKSSGPSTRIVAVGDRRQCHPLGTRIYVTGQGYLPIEELYIGQEVTSFNSQKSYFPGINKQGRKITNINRHRYTGNIFRISTNTETQLCTANHKCLARFNNKNFYCIYLMQKGDYFRIGIAQAGYNHGFGPATRARQEGADALWILTTAQTKDQALIDEKVICATYGLPDLMFLNNGFQATAQEALDSAWNRIGQNGRRAMACLKYFGRDGNFPIWEAEGENSHIGFYSFVTQACNLITGYMSVKTFHGNDKCSIWKPVEVNFQEVTDQEVIGLEVEPAENGRRLYIADGIVTHNSIYAFRGADAASMDSMRRLSPSWSDLPLTVTFRCPKRIVARQQAHAPGYTAWTGCHEGRFIPGFEREEAEEELRNSWGTEDLRAAASDVSHLFPEPSLAVLCRTNAPLLSFAFKLLRRNIGCYMLGRDIGKGLAVLSKKILPEDSIPVVQCVARITDWQQREASLAHANDKPEKADRIADQAESLLAVIDGSGAKDSGDLRAALDRLFSRTSGQLVLSSIHRAKGLEWDIVVHLDPWRLPPKWTRNDPVQLEQEKNLLYVAETRTRHTLLNLNLSDFR